MLRLVPVPQGGVPDGRLPGAQLVIVPSPEDEGPSKWAGAPSSWLSSLILDLGGDAQVRELVYPVNGHETTTIQQSLSAGQYLVEALAELCNSMNGEIQPILLFGYGFGGYTLLKALCIIRDRIFQYRQAVDLVAGIMFLGVPNVARNADTYHETLELMVRSRNPSIKSITALLPAQDAESVLDLCKAFELIPLTIPVFSLYEKRPTSIQKTRFGVRKMSQAVIVSENLCSFNKHDETILEVDADHHNIYKLPAASEAFRLISQKLTTVVQSASQRLTTTDGAYNAPSELQKLSLRSETASEPAGARSIHRPTNATLEPPGQVANASPAQGTIGSSIALFHVIPSTVPFEVSSSDLSLPCFSMGVCQKNNDFFGREDVLQQIDEFLLPCDDPRDTDASTLRSFAICGLGGIGKTELAVQYAYTRRKHFEAIFWLGADNATLLEDEFARIAARLGLEDADEKNDLAASRELVKGWLTSPGRKTSNNIEGDEVPWLLIFDNVDDMDVLSDYWPTHGHGSVLITSRDPLAKNNVYTVRDGVDLPPFSTQETVDFMQKTTQIRAQGPSLTALSQIADRIQGLPIAVKQIAAIIREFRMSYADFLKFYDREGMQRAREILSRAREGVNDSSLAIVWALDKLSPGANALLCVMSLLHPDNFPEYLVSSESNTIDLPEFPSNSAEYYLARANLLQSSLVSQHEESETLSVHRLVQDTAKNLIDDDRLFSVFRAAFSLVSTQWPLNEIENTYDISRHDRCAQIFPSILKLKMGLEELFRQHPGLKVDHSIAKLLNNSGWYLNERGNPGESMTFFRFALTICDRLGPAEKETEDVQSIVRESNCFLGCTESDVANYSASMKHLKTWLQLAEERKDETGAQVKDFELGVAYNEVGCAHADIGVFEKAEDYFRTSIDMMKQAKGYEPNWLGWAQPNLGLLLCILGRHEEARTVLEEILAIFDDEYGDDDNQAYKKGKILFGLGNVFKSLEQHDKSVEHYHKSLKEYVAAVGHHHFRFGDVCYRLAGHYIHLGAYSDADAFLKQAIGIFSAKTYFKEQLARAHYRHSELLKLMGHEDKALQELKKAADLRKQCILYDGRPIEELRAADFEPLVNWMSR